MAESRCEQFSSQKTRKESSLQFPENFYVVQFHDGLALVPNNWLQETIKKQQVCFYPNYDVKKRLNKAIWNKELPDLKNVKKLAGQCMMFYAFLLQQILLNEAKKS